jgi:DNA replication protein DnaC
MFAGGNTSRGFFSLYSNIIDQEATRIIVIKGGPGVGKSTFMKYIGDSMVEKGHDVEYFHCSSDPESLDGLVIPGLRVALIDGTAPHIVDPRFPGAVDEILHLGDYWDEAAMRSHRQEIIRLTKEVGCLFQRAYRFLRAAGDILDDWSDANSEALDFGEANRVARTVLDETVDNAEVAASPGHERHLFASAITPLGFVNYLDTVVSGCPRRFILEGGPGSGKSTLISKVAQRVVECGYDVELYHCSLNPSSLEHLVVPALGVAVITSVEPHLWVPAADHGPDEVLVDMDQCLDPRAVDKNAEVIAYDREMMNKMMDRAVIFLKQALEAHDTLESFYIPNIDFDAVRGIREQTLQRILGWEKEMEAGI